MNTIIIREVTEKDFPAVLALVKELAVIDKGLDQVTNTVEQMKKEKDFFHGFVAETEYKEIVGIAIYFFVYSTWVGKSLYLEDFIVKEAFRRKGIGTNLIKKIFEVAKKTDCKRVRWQVLNDNEQAINFYKKLGATINDEWDNCDFDAEGIKNFQL